METIRILGIDPGSTVTGWGVVDYTGARLGYVASGVVRPSARLSHAEKLRVIHEGLLEALDAHQPHAAAVEKTFVNASPRDALILGQARGIALLAPAQRGLPVSEFAANAVKKSVVGQGHAGKAQVQLMVKALLPKSNVSAADEADALAVAICCAHHGALEARAAS